MRDLSDRFRVVSVLGFLRIHSTFSHYYQWFPVSPDNMCMSEADHKNWLFNQLLACNQATAPSIGIWGINGSHFRRGKG